MTSPFRIAIAGAGRFGSLHARAWSEAGAQVVAAVDTDPERARVLAFAHGSDRHGTDLGEVLRGGEVGAVVVATDEASHTRLTDQAIEHGCHVFVEKPFSLSSTEAARSIAAAEAAGLHIIAGHVSRFAQPYAYMREALDAGRLGDLWSIRLRRDFTRGWLADFGHRVHPVWESCIHDIDLAIYFTGECPESVYALQVVDPDTDAPASMTALLRFPSGRTATIESAWSIPDRGPQSLAGALALDGTIAGEAELIGANGTVRQRLISDALVEWNERGVFTPDLSLWPERNGRIGGALSAEIEHALAVFSSGAENTRMPHRESLWSVATAEAMIGSLERGAPEAVITD
ncbi:Gfo/Idh/MocA family oxidoreductase [Microbacterium sp. zg-Y818]|uniref:Gfo/Idh/MocA family oxidoreductase n=1 Tax=unclassified Microbacterium TaxID=2609290 RepID=UPI00214B8664|nr:MULTISPECIES: Gfo/Idh/MocA family oxidoreductase [unclassified Microbacterium]MCR2800220.1 Gfo/Idh/MocA family oxidoreductase [Microbacterium sp. zg.Y818]WIM22187.1 Gfo/Idh/MocA family oxidoreductase [Microbacterium sp. zg-Y818]